MERVRELYDPDAVVRPPPEWPEPGPYFGREAILDEFRRLRDTYDSDSLDFVSDFAAQGDRVMVRMAWHAKGRGPTIDFESTLVYTLRKGRILGLEYFRDHGEALEAMGLAE